MLRRRIFLSLVALSTLGACAQSTKNPEAVDRTVASTQVGFWNQISEFCLEVADRNIKTCDPYSGVDSVIGAIELGLKRSTRLDRLEKLSQICQDSLPQGALGCTLSAGKEGLLKRIREIATLQQVHGVHVDFWTDTENFCKLYSRSQFPQCSRHLGIQVVSNAISNSCREAPGCQKRAIEICQRYAADNVETCQSDRELKTMLQQTAASEPAAEGNSSGTNSGAPSQQSPTGAR